MLAVAAVGAGAYAIYKLFASVEIPKPTKIQAEEHRNMSRELRKKADGYHTLFLNSTGRDKQKAKQERDICNQKANEADKRAAELFFEDNNRDKKKNEVDLHNLYVKEAIFYATQAIKEAKANGLEYLILIYGQGNNSADGVAKLKPAVLKLIEEYKLKCTPGLPNPGCVYIEFAKPGESYGWFSLSSCCIL